MEIARDLKSEKEIWELFLNGSNDAYADLYKTYFHLLYDFGLRLHPDKEVVKDCIQDLFIKLWSNRQNLQPVKSIRAYLFTALRNSITNKLSSAHEKYSKAGLNQEEQEGGFTLNYSIEEHIIQQELNEENIEKLLTALNMLTPRQKECIYLRYHIGLEYDEIAGLLGITKKASYKLLARALDILKSSVKNAHSLLPFLLACLNLLSE